MKKLALLLASLMVLSLALVGCSTGKNGDANVTSGTTSGATDGNDTTAATPFDASALALKAVDEQTFEVKLKVEAPYFLDLVSFPTFSPVPMHMVEQYGDAWATDPASYIGNGAYQVTEFVPSSHILMEKNASYWDANNVGPQKIRFMLMEDSVARLNSFQAGELDYVLRPPQDEIAKLKTEDTFGSFVQLGTYYISMNNQSAPFDNELVRKAFSLAIDRDHIANIVCDGLYEPAEAWVPPSLSDADKGKSFRDVGKTYFDVSADSYKDSLAEAKAALEEAGYPNGEGFPAVTYIYNNDAPHKQVAEALQDMWKQLGVTVNLEIQEWATFLQSRKSGEYQLARDGWLCDYNDPMSMLDMFITGSGNNNSQYSNPEYDALVTELKSTGDNEKRFELMHKLEDTLMENWVFAPVMYYKDTYLCNPELLEKGVWNSPLGYQYFMFAEGYDELTVCIGPNPDTIDPALNSSVDGATTIIHTFEGLYRLNKDGVPEPSMAESVEISDDGLTYTFHLRDGIAWSDGTPITAQTFVDSWTRVVDPNTAADYSYMYEAIEGYDEAIGDAAS